LATLAWYHKWVTPETAAIVKAVHLSARLFFYAALAAFGMLSARAAEQPPAIPAAPELAAKAYILIDANSGRVLAERNADDRLEPASLTKIMTAYVVFHEMAKGKVRLDEMVTVSEKAWRTEGSRMFAQVGAQISVENLLKGMIVQSGNDASVALAEHIAGDESVFAQMMNQNAERLGLTNTHFKNSMGLPDPEHYATARDLARLSQALIREFPEHYQWHAIKEFEFNGIKQVNRNRLLWSDPTVDGVKTGHTKTAGYCLVTSALRDGMRLLAVVMGTASDKARSQANQALLNYGFRFYETKLMFKAGEPVTQSRIYKGEVKQLPIGFLDDFYATYPRGQYSNLKATMETGDLFVAPVQQGDKAGSVKVSYNNEVIAQRDMVALQTVDEGGIFRRMFDQILLWLK